ncbi:Phospho-2-dehydro-3-deoxyheptonate aldolase [Petrocella atlantisensis]|uniref:Phospho-2-dehydro-3-deoxyheptonate aldolase n=1 Tax=Petrocella atlantisensis TaxID=2173034 RepID=A0A3P7NYF6_9FIRM|nr:3-deoxy-7-phosphoheptulonate synthase [Petrocella atlantisensis]VDN47995.1 Phospho-2-dehydro-3-deoxyheptonate aldolase [Petrocella atlantisensis]
MIFVMKQNVEKSKVDAFRKIFEDKGFKTLYSFGTDYQVVGLVGNTSILDVDQITETNVIVEYGKRITEPFKMVNRKFQPENTYVKVGPTTFGEGLFQVIAGPCSVENENQIMEIARAVKLSGATLLRGGAFKPRSSPYAFQGLHAEGIQLLLQAKKETGLPIVSELTSLSQFDLFEDVDVIQVGARNMQNFDMLRELGLCKKAILLKRGLASTIEEFLMSAEYIMTGGNSNIILCERGIRTIETMTRNTLDISAVPLLKKLSHLPVIIDPSHAGGMRSLVAPLTKAAIAIGADGILIETHNNPAEALSDGAQSLDLSDFSELMVEIERRVAFENKKLDKS